IRTFARSTQPAARRSRLGHSPSPSSPASRAPLRLGSRPQRLAGHSSTWPLTERSGGWKRLAPGSIKGSGVSRQKRLHEPLQPLLPHTSRVCQPVRSLFASHLPPPASPNTNLSAMAFLQSTQS
ncbi:unnamed protein product, partial [Protopolystoma xenopodis]